MINRISRMKSSKAIRCQSWDLNLGWVTLEPKLLTIISQVATT